ncbi:MAG: hypothetical protein ABTQ34_06385 [Bdellovibrionales bacterium]
MFDKQTRAELLARIEAVRQGQNTKSVIILFLFSILIWAFDFKAANSGEGALFQAPLLFSYFLAFFLILNKMFSQKIKIRPLVPLAIIAGFFIVPSAVMGLFYQQNTWILFTNSIPSVILVMAAISTFCALSSTKDYESLLSKMQWACLISVVIHFCVVAFFQKLVDLSGSRNADIANAMISPIFALLVISLLRGFTRLSFVLSCLGLTMLLLSVYRSQLLIIILLTLFCFIASSKSFFRKRLLQGFVIFLGLGFVLVFIDNCLPVSYLEIWFHRLTSVSRNGGVDPTSLTRIAEYRFMFDAITDSFEHFMFGNGLAAQTSLIGRESALAATMVGWDGVLFHSNGFGHNSYLSLIFIGGMVFGLPFASFLLLTGFKGGIILREVLSKNPMDKNENAKLFLAGWGLLIMLVELIAGFQGGSLGQRPSCAWWGIGIGFLYWVRKEVCSNKQPARKSGLLSRQSNSAVLGLFLLSLCASPSCAATTGVSLTAKTNKPQTNLFSEHEPVEIFYSVAGLPPKGTARMDIHVSDAFGQAVSTQTTVNLTADAAGTAQYRFSPPASKLGYYEVSAMLDGNITLPAIGSRPRGIITYAIVTAPSKRTNYGEMVSRFGMQRGYSPDLGIDRYLGLRYSIDIKQWEEKQPPSSNSGNFVTLEQAEEIKARQSIASGPKFWVRALLRTTLPKWAIVPATQGSVCKNFGALNDLGMDAFHAYVTKEVAAFAGQHVGQERRYYQLTWEPGAKWCINGTPDDLVAMYKKVYTTIHQIDPKALVAGPTLFIDAASTSELRGLWHGGLGHYIDAFSVHPYVKAWPPETNGLPNILREQLADATKAVGRKIPFISTEHSFSSVREGNLKKALGDVRSTIILLGEGASFVINFYGADFWGNGLTPDEGYGFFWNLNPQIPYATDTVSPKAVVPAYAAMTFFLDGSTSSGPLPGLKGTQMGYRFVRDLTTIDVVWDYKTASHYAPMRGAKICDWMGNCEAGKTVPTVTVGAAPTYFISDQI